MRSILVLFSAFFCFAVHADVTNIEAKGNLESNNPSGCTGISGLSNKNTPADIFMGIKNCLDKDNYANASQLYLAALAYGKYDTIRVEDKTAHQAITVLRLNHLGGLGKEKTEKLQSAIKKSAENMGSVCDSLKQLGRPDYYPRYMIQHGMGAFLGNKSKDGLDSDFDPNKAWVDVLSGYVKCPS